jgi:hypothetical protein
MFGLQRLPEQRIFLQVDHACRQVVAGPPVGIDFREYFRRQRFFKGFHFGGSNGHDEFLLL